VQRERPAFFVEEAIQRDERKEKTTPAVVVVEKKMIKGSAFSIFEEKNS
jgi:hypothetical protein